MLVDYLPSKQVNRTFKKAKRRKKKDEGQHRLRLE